MFTIFNTHTKNNELVFHKETKLFDVIEKITDNNKELKNSIFEIHNNFIYFYINNNYIRIYEVKNIN